MSIRPVKDLPARAGFRANGDSYVAADLREFIRKGMDVALIEHDGKKPESVAVACKKFIKAYPEQYRGVHAGVRGGRAYVWREYPR